mmetsp:Transcript_585/g.580  ORF Transcript_585/g.580 Transcript_585/m.580 type:complete len:96 (-) Transcript_585:88-375(-)
MAGLVLKDGYSLNIAGLAAHMQNSLATYAMPMFIRILPQMDSTGTFKQRKVDLVKEGFDPNVILDPLFVFDVARKEYVDLTPQKYVAVCTGKSRL